MKNKKVYPFLQWAGGKRQLLGELNEKINMSDKTTYIEPFVGAGALFIDLLNNDQFEQIIINDINTKLINVYKTIKEHPKNLIEFLSVLENEYNDLKTFELKKEYYLKIRKEFNQPNNFSVVESAWFIFLNKTCFNGLYRENKKGCFNVSFGTGKNVKIFDEENIRSLSELLNQKNVIILNKSFEELKEYINDNTFVYFDPPYRPITKGGFNTYNSSGFNDDMQIKLKEFVDYCNNKNAHTMLSNSDPNQEKSELESDTFFSDLYKNYIIEKVYARRSVNSDVNNRGKVSELLITNFKGSK